MSADGIAGLITIGIIWMLSNLLFGIFSAIFAAMKTRSILGWFLIGSLFSFFGLLVIFFPKKERRPLWTVKPKIDEAPAFIELEEPEIDPQQAHASARFRIGNWDEQTNAKDLDNFVPSLRDTPSLGDGLI